MGCKEAVIGFSGNLLCGVVGNQVELSIFKSLEAKVGPRNVSVSKNVPSSPGSCVIPGREGVSVSNAAGAMPVSAASASAIAYVVS